jgi:hypothetical protein
MMDPNLNSALVDLIRVCTFLLTIGALVLVMRFCA